MRTLELTDPTSAGSVSGSLDQFLLTLIHDPRDLPLLRTQLFLAGIGFPLAIMVYAFFNVWTVALFLGFYFWQLGPYTLMLHNVSHRRHFRDHVKWLEWPLVTVLGTIFGHTPEGYFAHHIGMHHPENNLDSDLSTTLHLRRDSAYDFFVKYLGRFLVIGEHELSVYLRDKKRTKIRKRYIMAAIVFWSAFAVLCYFNWQATLVVFFATMLFTRGAMMAGNWGQHAFVDPTRPENCYVNSITCINSSYNKRCFNDGYHISHHWKASRHWTEHPDELRQNIARYAEADAIIFEKIDFFTVWLFLMFKRYEWLAKHYVQIGDRTRSQEEIIELLRARTRPVC